MNADQNFELFETMYATRDSGVRHVHRHLERLQASAKHFAFEFNQAMFHNLLRESCGEMSSSAPYRVRLLLRKNGELECSSTPLLPLSSGIVRVLLAFDWNLSQRYSSDDLLRHKTTSREYSDAGWRKAEAHGAFDMLFFNERSELTEGGRSNIFVKLDSHWFTPTLSSGLLPGVMRAVILEDPTWNATERVLTWDDLMGAEDLVVCNALRGAIKAVVERGNS
jgi:para-aminobenzoate synthetase / 4-amino-4-deoxychorismate lyase